MSTKSKMNSTEPENMCVVCFKTFEIYSVGICDHPVCFECSTRMRVLCRQNECPICRQVMPKVVFTTSVQPFRYLKAQYINTNLVDRRYNIWFQDTDVQKEYYRLLEHNCTKCKRREPFKNFQQLKEHMRKDHELYYCDLCVLNLRIFTWERKCYTRQELAQHRRKGDVDDTSHRGHPQCKFCDIRYMDNDELYRHLRRDHLFCHFCDADGFDYYYSSYSSLRQHFENQHFLCEEGDCINEKFTSVFRTDIDLKAHKASVHSKHMSKAANKQARTLELEFTLAPRPRTEPQSTRTSRKPTNAGGNDRLQEEGAVGYDQEYTEPTTSRGIMLTAQDFPSLGGSSQSSAPASVPLTRSSGGNVTIRHITRGQQGLARTDENFPALSSDTGTLRFSVNSAVGTQDRLQTTTMANTPNVSIQVNHRPNGAITTHICQTSNNNSVRVRPRSDAFPALSAVSVPDAQWIKPLPKESKPKVSKVAPAPVLPVQNSSNDFPSLSKTEQKTKKSSSVTVPVSASASTTVAPPVEQTDSKKEIGKNKKKKSKANNSNNISNLESSSSQNKPTSAWEDKSPKKDNSNSKEARENGVIKKRTELKIDSLQISEPSSSNKSEDFPVLGASKPPPGFTVHAPPGFAANDLTFTNSSGQSFSILPSNQFSPPPNFSQRNKKLVESFMSSLESNDAIIEFKNLSSMFRNNLIPADRYYDQCKEVMGNDFEKIFPELLVLLPDIEKQQELYVIYNKNAGNKRGLDVCATCRQVVTSADLRNHLNTHSLQNHFPNLAPKEVNSVWKK